jgi:crotonobetainyl-CoA:carnitine CoA-transferase CaiB-like acyl-CoA transferase
VFADAQVKARELEISLPHAAAGQAPGVASPLRLSKTPVSYRRSPPVLGAHTREVLAELLGMSADELDALAARGVI